HAAETLMGKFRDGMPVTGEAVTVILSTIDRIKNILDDLETQQAEPAGADTDLIAELERMVLERPAGAASPVPAVAAPPANQETTGSLTFQVLERQLRVGEVPLDELERAFRETAGPEAGAAPAPAAKSAEKPAAEEAEKSDTKIANQTLRVNVETLEHLMTMVSELVLTRNQLLE